MLPPMKALAAGARGPKVPRAQTTAAVAAMVGHELRAPLAAALLYLRIAKRHLRSCPENERVSAAIAATTSEVWRLERLISRVIEIERMGRAIVSPRLILLDDVVRRAISRFQEAVLTPRAEVAVVAPAPISGFWDDLAVEQIVHNLLSNAIKFGRGRPVQVSVERAPGRATILVRDRGPGIRAADRERIFHRSVRAPGARAGGLGLGLWLVRELARAHGGEVAVQSRVGRGATFVVTLAEWAGPPR
jgi:signal transduction histidine kinase